MHSSSMEKGTFKNVVVIGNGPSAITLSYMLAGNWPYYNGLPHHIEFLQHRLEEHKDKSLLEQDLSFLSEGLEGRSLNPVSVLFDTLVRPQADLGVENPSVISWKHDSHKAIDHVVLGKGVPGGSWQKMDSSTLTISLSSWMELPNLNIQEWDTARSRLLSIPSGLRQKRITIEAVSDYYLSYVEAQGLNTYFKNNTTVTSVSAVDQEIAFNLGYKNLWKVQGYTENLVTKSLANQFSYISPNLVLATGNSDKPNKLNVEGEDLPFVLNSLAEFELLIKKDIIKPHCGQLLIVGAGLSAADAVIAARFYGFPIIHVFRRSFNDPDLVFNKLPGDIYPEYHKVHHMMQNSSHASYEGYKAYPHSEIHKIKDDGTVIIKSCENEKAILITKVTCMLVLIGREPDLSFLTNPKSFKLSPEEPIIRKKNSIHIKLYNHESIMYPGLFAVGPIVGDNFVRFVQGGCLAVASHISNHLT